MLILVDTNVLLRLVEQNHPHHATAMEATAAVRRKGYRAVIVPQIIYEFWVVTTRPVDVNGLGMSAAEAQFELEELTPSFRLLRDERAIFEIWQQLVLDYDVKGKQVHDARLVAAMLRHNITQLLTFDSADFARYPKINIVEPHRVGALGIAK
jgi:predicted nucleic acid-binding protein